MEEEEVPAENGGGVNYSSLSHERRGKPYALYHTDGTLKHIRYRISKLDYIFSII